MLKPKDDIKLYVATEPIDMRKEIDGLSIAVVEKLKQDPQQGHLFIFHNRPRNKVKLLHWDKNGFMLIYKRLEQGRFQLPKASDADYYEIDSIQLQWLLAGFDFMRLKGYPELNFSHYF